MPRVRYECPVPYHPGMTAFAPIPMHYARVTTAYKSHVVGQPGTLGIPAPTWNARQVDQYRPDDLGPGSKNQPDVWYPNLYYQTQHQFYGIGGVAIFSDNLLPVPAIDPRLSGLNTRVSVQQADWQERTAGPRGFPGRNDFTKPVGRQSGSQRQTRWPRKSPRWPSLIGGRDRRG
jgi:hypothetical protein